MAVGDFDFFGSASLGSLKIEVSDLVNTMQRHPSKADVMFVSPVSYAMLNAHIDNQHRDRRRIKREVNKAAKRAKQNRPPHD